MPKDEKNDIESKDISETEEKKEEKTTEEDDKTKETAKVQGYAGMLY